MLFSRTATTLAISLTIASPAAGSPLGKPQLVSPTDPRQEPRVGSACPTFIWTAVPEARGYSLRVYEVGEGSRAGQVSTVKPLAEAELPAGASSWAPTLDDCLPGPGRYGWTVGARGASGEIQWSTPGVFRVVGQERELPRERPEGASATVLDGVASPVVSSFAGPSEPASSGAPAPPRSLTGEAFSPPECNGSVFSDVTLDHPLCAWIEKSSADQIVTECAAGRYCPDNPVTRGQLALFGERIMRGTDTWRPETGDGATPNLPPGPPTITTLDTDLGITTSSITIGADGLGLISYRDTNVHLNVAHCSNVNCTGATITPIDTDVGPGFGFSTSITIGADGLGLISYQDNSPIGVLKVVHCSDLDCTAATITTLDTTVGGHTSITIGADGLGLISYYHIGEADLKVAHCSNVNCTAATITTLDDPVFFDGVNVGEYTSITIGADGFGLISYYDATNDELKVAHCSNVNCTAATITTLDDPAAESVDVGSNTSITIGADGLGLISYSDRSNIDLKVAHCTNINCTAATITSLDTAGLVADLGTSVTIGADGLGLISYHTGTAADGNLKVAHCSNINCTLATLTNLDTVGNVGQNSSITIGADGLGLISYRDSTNGNLKVVHCPNVLCVPHFRRR